MRKIEIKKGERFSRLVVIKETKRWIDSCGKQRRKFLCKCDCGTEKEIKLTHLLNAKTASCGCLQREAIKKIGGWNKTTGLSTSRTYDIWSGMRSRCDNPKNHAYHLYGAKGINYCKKWSSFEGFLEDMGESPSGLTLDRVDGTRGYCKENCRWADWYTQANNKCNNRIINYKGVDYTLAQLSRKVKMKKETLQARLRRGWSIEESVNSPLKWGMHK